MTFKIAIFILIHLIALVYFVETLRRIDTKVKEYNLKDTAETLPFGFVRLRHVVIFYVLAYTVWVIGSVFLYLYFVDPSDVSVGESIRNNFELNL